MQEEQLNAHVLHVVFASPDSGFAVLICRGEIDPQNAMEEDQGKKSRELRFYMVGVMPQVSEGMWLEATGSWVFHPRYGRQFKVSRYTAKLPTGTMSIQNYLASGVIKGVGEALAKRIVDAFGEDTFHVIETEPERLSEIKGITPLKAVSIATQFAENAAMRDIMLFMQDYGISSSFANRIYQEWGKQSVEKLKKNPYLLVEDIPGIGFQKADEVASRMGFLADSSVRLKAFILHLLSECSVNGHTYLTLEALQNLFAKQMTAEEVQFENAITELRTAGKIRQVEEAGEERIYPAFYYKAESYIAERIGELMKEYSFDVDEVLPKKVMSALSKAEASTRLTLSEEQRSAVKKGLTAPVLVITGGPGTGKTTIIKVLTEYFNQNKIKYLLAAPTGRAAKRMQEATGEGATTLHRLLEYQAGGMDGKAFSRGGIFARNVEHPLETQVIIVDEMSMVDLPLFYHLMEGCGKAHLILVGDKDQLPSVGPGSVLSDLIKSQKVPVCELTYIYRQEEASDIVLNAHRVRRGEMPAQSEPAHDFFMVSRPNAEDSIEELVSLVEKRLPEYYHLNAKRDIQVLCPMRHNRAGVENLNTALQEKMNPPSPKKAELTFNGKLFREGDRVMQLKNDYELEWEVRNKYDVAIDSGEGVFNGDIGFVKSINKDDHSLVVLFEDGKEAEYEYTLLEELDLAYALTIHKAQGTEAKAVIIVLNDISPRMYSRNLLYTAITRARECVILLGDMQVVGFMSANDSPMRRNSGLSYKLEALG